MKMEKIGVFYRALPHHRSPPNVLQVALASQSWYFPTLFIIVMAKGHHRNTVIPCKHSRRQSKKVYNRAIMVKNAKVDNIHLQPKMGWFSMLTLVLDLYRTYTSSGINMGSITKIPTAKLSTVSRMMVPFLESNLDIKRGRGSRTNSVNFWQLNSCDLNI